MRQEILELINDLEIGKEYEFCDFLTFAKEFTVIRTLKKIIICENLAFFVCEDGTHYFFIRPIQKKEEQPLTADELYRICGKNGYEVKAIDEDLDKSSDNYENTGIITAFSEESGVVLVGTGWYSPKEIIYFKKAYSLDPWKPISEIERE
jgi:hypothetical protein